MKSCDSLASNPTSEILLFEARLDNFEKRLDEILAISKSNHEFITKLKIEDAYKKEVRDSLAKWLRILVVFTPIVFGLVTYTSYHLGLYTPSPPANPKKK